MPSLSQNAIPMLLFWRLPPAPTCDRRASQTRSALGPLNSKVRSGWRPAFPSHRCCMRSNDSGRKRLLGRSAWPTKPFPPQKERNPSPAAPAAPPQPTESCCGGCTNGWAWKAPFGAENAAKCRFAHWYNCSRGRFRLAAFVHSL